ncbi:zinc ribbon domain-containing protein [Pseudanabaena sp. FACHB-2040]|uniref:zinc ribbon domain-containing protein n=1 Tax=Pseudanabaena sp. FACHB-2040 TaxID=2692859 RepID=UPI0016837B65|nr:zinc ribbon domain-containing protein [Pseudanabaena sp. FACHB-2040]MBD2257368.1 zinc ribbon domain-containing protein [Pseudanabaena sp. FACHB-2040]
MRPCPRCQAKVEANAIRCPQCGLALKAHGHPGIPLYRAEGEAALCESCTYHLDDTCTFPQRPHAETCTLYHNAYQDPKADRPVIPPGQQMRLWVNRRAGLIALVALIGISFLIVLVR